MPFFQSVAGRYEVYVVNVEVLVCAGIFRELFIESSYKAYLSVDVGSVLVSENTVKRKLEVVLDNRTAELFLYVSPDFLKVPVLVFEHFIYLLF